MKVTSAEIVISAVQESQYPKDCLPEFALIGRSNVGKSSFINTMLDRRALARTSSQPGKTQTMNFYLVNKMFYFVDLPGYGYAKVSQKEREKWGKMIEHYLNNRSNLYCVFHMVDLRHPPTEDDILMYNWLKYYNLNTVIVATKLDKIRPSQRQKNIKKIKKSLDLINSENLITFSALDKTGKEKAWAFIKSMIEKREEN
ncbi:MAG TPA: YihA family ribosome biogenesis GTP-binding protein [Eubacteriaceae bacterium]|jgi:GTP-binding protein|nr:YihA family ribosome biogenesis GTP-binding protein [Eubacteriaceae bacterium]